MKRSIALRGAGAGVVALGLVLSSGLSAIADTTSSSPSAELASDKAFEDSVQRLEALSSVQTPEQIDALKASGEPLHILTDEAGVDVAAEPITSRAVSIVGPGCSLNSACIVSTGNRYTGFQGWGSSLQGSWPSTKTFKSGDRPSSVWVNNKAYYGAPGYVRTFKTAINATAVSRS